MRRALLALIAVAGLVLSGTAAYVVFRPAQPPPLTVPTHTPWTMTPEADPGVPAHITITRLGATSGWTLASAVAPEALSPAPEQVPATRPNPCDEPHRMLASVAHESSQTDVFVSVVPKSFQEFTVTDIRVRFLTATPAPSSPRYLYHCLVPDAAPEVTTPAVVVDAGEGTWSARQRRHFSLPQTASGPTTRDVIAEFTVESPDQVRTWQIEIDYVHHGQTKTAVRTTDSRGFEFVSGPGPIPAEADANYLWCHAPKRRFVSGDC